MRLEIPEVPRSPNGQNGLLRMHWRTRARYWMHWGQLVRAAVTQGNRTPPEGRQRVQVVQFRRRKLDTDNLYASCKPLIDALVTWNLLRDDDEGHILLEVRQDVQREQRTLVEITPAGGSPFAETEE
jgi:Holliday junction resolvase RusA-like endonuclease